MPAMHPSHDDAGQKPAGAAADEDNARLVPTLLSIAKSTRALTGLKLAKLGFHNGQDELLFALKGKPQVAVSHLADEMGVRPSTVSKMLDRLVKAGLVERHADRVDGRRTMVQITSNGLEALRGLHAMRNELEAQLLSAPSKQSDEIVEALSMIAGLLRTRLRRHR